MVAAELIAETGPLAGTRFALEPGGALLVGRGDEMDIRLLDLDVTDAHCSVALRGKEGEVTDLESATGTWVNDHPVQASHRLVDGDVVRVGSTRLRFALKPVRILREETVLDLPSCCDPASDGSGAVLVDSQGWQGVRRRIGRGAIGEPSNGVDGATSARLRQRLAAICQMANTVHGMADRDGILGVVAETVLTVTGARRAAILLRQDGSHRLRRVVTRMRGDTGGRDGFVPSRTILREAVEKGYSVLTGDAAADDRFREGDSIVLQEIRSVMCVPLKADHRTLGAIYVEGCSVDEQFTEGDLSLLAAVGYQAGLAVDRVDLVRDLERLFFGTLDTLVAAIEAKDPYLEKHADNVCELALRMGQAMGLAHPDLIVLRLASKLHDVGKIGVPKEILTKEGRLDARERAEIEKHPGAGARIVNEIPRIGRLVDVDQVVAAIRHHHERWDGGGYPDGLAGEEIPLAARILTVADTFDAVTHNRPYHTALAPREAIALLQEVAGTQLDPDLVALFVRLFEEGRLARESEDPDRRLALAE